MNNIIRFTFFNAICFSVFSLLIGIVSILAAEGVGDYKKSVHYEQLRQSNPVPIEFFQKVSEFSNRFQTEPIIIRFMIDTGWSYSSIIFMAYPNHSEMDKITEMHYLAVCMWRLENDEQILTPIINGKIAEEDSIPLFLMLKDRNYILKTKIEINENDVESNLLSESFAFFEIISRNEKNVIVYPIKVPGQRIWHKENVVIAFLTNALLKLESIARTSDEANKWLSEIKMMPIGSGKSANEIDWVRILLN